ncbi:MAG TPA: alpha/beta hydrolase [Methylomirabilota bacterium]|nr:alpha/beta hydrolase [Methylomirabilota bacterium]
MAGAASNELSVREEPVGGAVRPTVKLSSEPFPQGRRRVVLLVHGYNNTEKAARDAYGHFTGDLDALGAGASSVLADLGKVYWPGDTSLGPLSFLSYPAEITPAKDSAAVLAAYLATLVGPGGSPTEIYLVGHSLGNRVILELLTRFAAMPLPATVQVPGGCLMAAAVQVDMVEPGGALRSGATLWTRTLTLYSRDDRVLHWAFPIGQTAAGEGFFPTAVGRFGQPGDLWTTRQELCGNGHSDYWGDPRAAVLVARLLGVAVAVDIPASAISRSAIPETPALPERALLERQIPEA